MTLNISFQVSGLAFLFLIIVLLMNRRLSNTSRLKTYLYLLTGTTVSTILDIVSVITLSMDDYKTSILTAIVCRLYLISIVIVLYLILNYVFVRLDMKKVIMKGYKLVLNLLIIGYIVLAFFADLQYYVSDDVVFTYGEYVSLAYIMAGFVLILMVVNAIYMRDKLDMNKLKPMVFLVAVVGSAVYIQFLNNHYLLVSFALSIAMVYMYLCLENPNEYTDRVSGVFNFEGAKMVIDENKEKKRIYFLVVFEDLKFYNDTFGFEVTTELIKAVASYLMQIPCEMVFRASNTTFVLVFDEEDTNRMMYVDKIRDKFKENFNVSNVNIVVKAKYYMFDQEDMDLSISNVIEYINYFVKANNDEETNDIVYIKKEQIKEKQQRDDVENSIIKALNNNELMVYYQPIYNNRIGKFTSAEALMRIKNNEGQFIPPDVFIPIAEKNGLIVKLGMELFEKVCSFIEENDLQNSCLDCIDVNLSVIQCMQHDLADNLLRVMSNHKIQPSFINFEITETAASNSESTLLMNMKKLIDKNSSFSLDDYGSGYSNINYVLELPICVLKYDKNMVWSSFEGEKGRVIMEYTVNMTKELRLKSLAEGVETKEQFERIKELGIEYTQGYYFSRPLPENEFLEKIKQETENNNGDEKTVSDDVVVDNEIITEDKDASTSR